MMLISVRLIWIGMRYKHQVGVGSGSILSISLGYEGGTYHLVANYYIPPDQAIYPY